MKLVSLLLRATLVTLLGLAVAGSSEAVPRYVNPDGVCGGNAPCYTTIQDAIDASSPGDLILVQAGTHSPAATIDVHTTVSIFGAMANVNALPSRGSLRSAGSAAESIIDGSGLGQVIEINADNVELNGLEIHGGSSDLVSSPSSNPLFSASIRNCIIHDATGDEGIQLRNIDGAVIECNYVYDTAGDGINLCCGSVGGIIRNNELQNISSGDAAIYVYDSSSTTIEGNLVDTTNNNDGIKLGSKGGSDAGGFGGSIYNNTTRNTAQDGISVYMSNTDVSCNDVSGSTSENGGIFVNHAVGTVSIQYNHVHDNTFDPGKWGDPAGIMLSTTPDASTVTVLDNNLSNNNPNGVTNKAAALLVAEGNWWGAADGPSGAGPGTGDAVSVNVDFDPWHASAVSTPCPPLDGCPDNPVPNQRATWGQIKTQYE